MNEDIQNNQIYERNADVALRVIENEAVILTPHDNVLHQLNNVGTDIWQLLNGKRSVQEVIDEMSQIYEASNERIALDTMSFLLQMREKKLIFLKATK